VMGAAKALTLQQCVGITREVAIGKEEQAHNIERQIFVSRKGRIYVSLVDIF